MLVLSGLVVVTCAADAVLFLQRAGSYLTGLKLVAMVILAAAATALIALWPTAWVYAAPILGFALFRGAVIHLIHVPDDAVIRDAQAGIAVFGVISARFVFVILVMAGIASAPAVGRRIAAVRKR